MRKYIRIIFVILTIGLIVIQFFQPQKNAKEISEVHIIKTENVPENITKILETSCFDCHSNTTSYKWYHQPAPVSWMINKHIIEGKDELNFSDWGEFDIFDKIGVLEEICKESERKTMPLKSYTLIHPKAKLTSKQIAQLCAWSEKLSMELLATVKN